MKRRRIFINGLNSKTGGGKSILNNYLTLLKNSSAREDYVVLAPDKEEYDKYASDRIRVIDIRRMYKKGAYSPFLYRYLLPKMLRECNAEAVFNLGDIALLTNVPQLYLFDWPYAAYPNSVVWKRMDLRSYLARRVKLFVFQRHIRFASKVIAQTNTMKTKLEDLYGLHDVVVVPNAVSLENLSGGETYDFNLPMGKIKLVYLTYYYSHKNLEVLIPLAREIQSQNADYLIVTTIDKSQHPSAGKFLQDVKKLQLDGIIRNVGPVDMKHVPSLYRQCDALLMPTLLESFSGTYVEAMYHGLPILTSDMDFARDVCGDAALYFDPLDHSSVLSCINLAFGDPSLRRKKIECGNKRLSEFLSWEQAFERYQELLERI